MRLQLDAGHAAFLLEAGDTVDGVAHLVAMLGGPQSTERVSDDGDRYLLHVLPTDDHLPFLVVVPKAEGIDPALLALCAVYVSQQDSPD